MVDILGWNDPLIQVSEKKYERISGVLWKISNISLRFFWIFLAVSFLVLSAAILLWLLIPGIPPIVGNLFTLPLFGSLSIAFLCFGIYNLSMVIFAIAAKDYLWAVGIFIFSLSWLYKFIKGGKLKKET
ncbi:hypothetical protein KAW38_02600 [Candidatus Micrarchaeota archaeon]|nr:hypothetical protein [Candidatus Micrarchaeota archaeon]